jgi:hypothetical protein
MRAGAGSERNVKNTVALLVLLLSMSCGSDATPGTGMAVPLESVAGAWRKAVCEKIYTCCSAAERMSNPVIGHDAESCQAALDGEITFFLGDLATSVREGRVVYHGDKMATCLADLQARSCDDAKVSPGELDVTQRCEGVFEPKVALGGACSEYWDCIGGWCAGDIGGLADRCTPKGAPGMVCDEGPECASGICDDGNACVSRPAGAGSVCNLGAVGEGQHTPPP